MTTETSESTELVVFEPSSVIVKYDTTDEQIEAKRQQYAGIVASDNKTRELAVEARKDVRVARLGVEVTRKRLKRQIIDVGRKVDGEADRITALLLEIENPLDATIKAYDNAKAMVKQAEEDRKRAELEAQVRAQQEAEAARLLAIRQEEERKLAEERERLAAEELRLAEQRRKQEAELAAARAKLEEEQRLAKLAADAEAERVRVERQKAREAAEKEDRERKAELERMQAAFEEEQRKAKAEQEAKERAEAERVARERAEIEAAQEKLRAEQEAAAKAEQDRLAKALAEAQAKQRAEQLAREAEEARVAELERQAALAARLEALKPDREKLFAYSVALLEVKCPELKDDEAKAFLVSFHDDLQELAFRLEAWGAQDSSDKAAE